MLELIFALIIKNYLLEKLNVKIDKTHDNYLLEKFITLNSSDTEFISKDF